VKRCAPTIRGFTLLELILVMLIIGLMLTVVVPSMGGLLKSQRLDQCARTVAGMLKEARVRAAADAMAYRLVIDTEDNTCWLEALTPTGFARPAWSVGKILELGDDLTLDLEGGSEDGTLLTVRVEPDGMAELAQVTITRTRDGEQRAVYCPTPTEAFVIGRPRSPQQLKEGDEGVEIDA
jgi:prepilin-type N-terminal cleavage/methylation domain-containing protein